MKALEQPNKSWLFRLINSAAFLWLATLAIVTLGGGYLSAHQQCVKDADAVADRYQKLHREVYVRQEKIHQVVGAAKTIAEIRDGIAQLPNNYAELKERTLFELTRELFSVSAKVDTSELPPEKIMGTFYRSSPFDALNQGVLPGDLTANGFQQLKEEAENRLKALKNLYFKNSLTELTSRCTIKNTLLYANGSHNVKIVSASPNLFAKIYGTSEDFTFVPPEAAKLIDPSLHQ
ncbi:MAG TPA: hypothetical protein VN844_26200 [Pyrinomonadaceae bacterium]|nr:hypothetical protein [Pyrinomonadaceae bacterium]